jgi:hypothetical protein
MKLGIPTLCRYDLLAKLIQSAEDGSELPDEYLIIDNGGKLDLELLGQLVETSRMLPIRLISPGENWGVARSWNHIIELAGEEPVVISNDDIIFNHKTFEEMAHATKTHPFVDGLQWALFAQTPECKVRVGLYDEHFYPAYYEDTDYNIRLDRAGIIPFCALSEPVQHIGWATTRTSEDAQWIDEMRERNRQYFVRKWGYDGPAENSVTNSCREPFNGETPPVFIPNVVPRTRPLMRWEIINHIAQKINARRYLEIGVDNGSCMRQIQISEKWGVDPAPQIEGVKAATVFVAKSSDAFFEEVAPQAGLFDVVFIDGLHHAEQVYRDIQNSLRYLSPKGVIVLHDCSPSTEAMQIVPMIQGEWTGDVWKTIVRLRQDSFWKEHICVVNSDYGVGIIIPGPAKAQIPALPALVPILAWRDLESNRKPLLGLLETAEWEAWFASVSENSRSMTHHQEHQLY